MTRWGLFLASIGCIMIIFSQTTKDSGVSLSTCLAGVLVAIAGFVLVYKDKKNAKSSSKPAKKR
ncbi:hypothetical protein [Absiella sp. AM29-15]|uniref:hypothetical protein n=1 Tax=Absiella sp. AM29-15 TaxID=2292278 RepID=UPI000E423F2A|nr:hypothetical protein [Absiella sp. AM29-15]RGC46398.1 hypothetical protein DW761_17295 [Absiella sp. AM29-15]